MTLQKSALEKEDNNYLLAQISFIEVEEIIAKEYWYHKSCRKDYTRPMKQLSQDVQKCNQAYMQLVTLVEQVTVKKGKTGFVWKNSGEMQINARGTRTSIYKRSHTEKFEMPSLNYL